MSLVKLLRVSVVIMMLPLSIIGQVGSPHEVVDLSEKIRELIVTDPIAADTLIQKLKTLCMDSQSLPCHADSLIIMQADVYDRQASVTTYRDIKLARQLHFRSDSLYRSVAYESGIHKAMFRKALLWVADGKYHEAITAFDEYIAAVAKSNDALSIAKAEYEKSTCYQRIGFQDSAMVFVMKAIPVFEVGGHSRDLANAYGVVGIANRLLSQFDESKSYFNQSIEIFEKLDNQKGLNRMRANLANTYFSEGDTLSAIATYKTVARSAAELSDNRTRILSYYNISNGYYQLSQYDSASVYIDKAIAVSGGTGSRMKYMLDYKKGAIDIEQGETDRGLRLLEGAYDIAIDLRAYVDARDMAHYLDRGYSTSGNIKQAIKYSRKFAELKDSVISIESNKMVNELKTKYETEKKELQIENLELANSKQRQRLTLGAVALGFISILSFFLLQLYRKVRAQKAVIAKALSEKDLLLREIHHRVKNNLQLVSSLLTLQGRSIDDEMAQQAIREGQSRVRSMALIHQDLYNKENLMDIGVKQYVEKLTQELFDTYRVDKNRIILQMDVQDMELDVDTLVPLGLIINELITNSLKYAFPEGRKGNLLLSLSKTEGLLYLRVSDDGVGYDFNKVKSNSFGSTLINALTEQLEGTIETFSQNGTRIEITVPIL